MLELASRIGLRVNVADLLHLQAAFHAACIIDPTSYKEHILCIGLLGRKPLQTLLILDDLLDLLRQAAKLPDIPGICLFVDPFAHLCKLHCKHIHRDELRTVRLRRRHRYLRSG